MVEACQIVVSGLSHFIVEFKRLDSGSFKPAVAQKILSGGSLTIVALKAQLHKLDTLVTQVAILLECIEVYFVSEDGLVELGAERIALFLFHGL